MTDAPERIWVLWERRGEPCPRVFDTDQPTTFRDDVAYVRADTVETMVAEAVAAPKPDPTNPNSANFAKPYFMLRGRFTSPSLSERIKTTQRRLTAAHPAKITLPELPEALRAADTREGRP